MMCVFSLCQSKSTKVNFKVFIGGDQVFQIFIVVKSSGKENRETKKNLIGTQPKEMLANFLVHMFIYVKNLAWYSRRFSLF